VSLINTPLGFFWSEFHDGIAMPLKSTICFFYFHLFFALFTVYTVRGRMVSQDTQHLLVTPCFDVKNINIAKNYKHKIVLQLFAT
jgi:hypothetical protein